MRRCSGTGSAAWVWASAAAAWLEWEKKYPKSPLRGEALLARSWNALRRDALDEAKRLLDQIDKQSPSLAVDPRKKLAQAAEILARQPQAIQLRYLETLTVIAADKNSTIVFPLPMDVIGPLLDALKRDRPAPP